ncbi:MAG: hypothetical protein E6I08_10800 [Chloroflexi bacterium]|nr:MAG: hypothetical protein E6I08_10800 [Chloroflexota bacterium]
MESCLRDELVAGEPGIAIGEAPRGQLPILFPLPNQDSVPRIRVWEPTAASVLLMQKSETRTPWGAACSARPSVKWAIAAWLES